MTSSCTLINFKILKFPFSKKLKIKGIDSVFHIWLVSEESVWVEGGGDGSGYCGGGGLY